MPFPRIITTIYLSAEEAAVKPIFFYKSDNQTCINQTCGHSAARYLTLKRFYSFFKCIQSVDVWSHYAPANSYNDTL